MADYTLYFVRGQGVLFCTFFYLYDSCFRQQMFAGEDKKSARRCKTGKEWYQMKMYDVYVSELCEGNLSKENTNFTLEQCKAICEQLIEGLSQLENSKICHNDLKPQNILYKKSDEKYEDGSSKILIKIGDFGTAGRSGAGFGMTRQ